MPGNMNLDLSGRTALVTGGARRIGRAIALALAEHGASVVVHYRNSTDEAEKVTRDIEGLGARAWTLQADLANQDDLENLIGRAVAAAGRLDILINNASMFHESTLEDVSLDQLLESIKLEAWAPLVLGRTFAAEVGSGHIVNILDTRAFDYDWAQRRISCGETYCGSCSRGKWQSGPPGLRLYARRARTFYPPLERTGLSGRIDGQGAAAADR